VSTSKKKYLWWFMYGFMFKWSALTKQYSYCSLQYWFSDAYRISTNYYSKVKWCKTNKLLTLPWKYSDDILNGWRVKEKAFVINCRRKVGLFYRSIDLKNIMNLHHLFTKCTQSILHSHAWMHIHMYTPTNAYTHWHKPTSSQI